ncbi:MAG: penicillin-binding protein 2 [Acidimicrobiales bacterium]|nr:penicillin-binding protein 2 [Acidimicrobiales bacterium]
MSATGSGNRRVEEGNAPRLRLSIVAIVATALFASLFARLYDLQVVGADDYQVQAEANRVRTVQVPAPRGRILDRHGNVLVDNRVAVVVSIDRSALAEVSQARQDEVLSRLTLDLAAAGKPVTVESILARLEDRRFSRYAPVPVVVDVPEELKIYLEEHAELYPGVVVERTAVRSYPYGPLAAHILGYVGKIDEEQFEELKDETAKPYTINDEIGISGVEQTYEPNLRGTPGVRRIEVDAQGDPVRVISEQAPQAGDDLVLSIDVQVQALAEQKVQQGLADARGRVNRDGTRNNGHRGAAVVLDPNNGQVIALASTPSYDPTIAVDGFDNAEWAALNDEAAGRPLYASAVRGEWAPGSTYKLFVGYAAMMAGIMGPDTVFNDGGGYSIPGCDGSVDPKCYRTNAGGAAYGRVTMQRAITVSSDAYFYNVGAQFWLQRETLGSETAMQDQLALFGLGQPTDIALTAENAGRVPSRAWRADYCEALDPAAQDTCYPGWSTGDNVNMAIGQGDVLVTPLQLANGYATFANGGHRYVPQIALRTQRYQTTEVTEEFAPQVAGEVPMPPHVRQPLYEGLVNVPVNGTAVSAFSGFPLATYPIAGKTGTAQVAGKADTAVFAAFGPAPAPAYAVSVMLEESGFGGTAAAPVARALFDGLSGVVPLQPVGPNGLPVGTAQGLAEGGGVD